MAGTARLRARPSVVAAVLIGILAAPGAPTVAVADGWALSDMLRKLTGRDGLPEGFAASNGRLEAEQVQISAKIAGRVTEVLVEEGDMVDAGTVVARIDDLQAKAQLANAEALQRRAERARAEAEAMIAQRDSELLLAQQEFERAKTLEAKGYGTTQTLDQRRSALNAADASKRAAVASLAAAEAEIDAANADVDRYKSLLADTVLVSPRRGRVEYKLVQAGEVVSAGAPVVTLLDLSDVYMTVFYPAGVAGRLALGDEARIVLDPVPQYVVPATVSFVAAEAQFTPKTVETQDEREKLVFRVKLRIGAPLLEHYEAQVKTGVRGIGYVRFKADAAWPDDLAVKLPGQ